MRPFRSILLLLAAAALAAATSMAQEDDAQPSLGDVARQARLQKQKQAQAETKDQAASPSLNNAQANSAQGTDSSAKTSKAAGGITPNDAVSKTAAGKDVSAKDTLAKGSKKVITNDEIPEHVGPTSTLPQHPRIPVTPEQPVPEYADGKVPPQYWKNQIQALKQAISDLESQIQDVSDSIRYAGSNCVSNCAQVNAEQQQRQQQVEMMTSQLEQQQKNLENMQETARKQGYGSSVYDP
jgi:hypothetical protein